jgi:hypothetical protein
VKSTAVLPAILRKTIVSPSPRRSSASGQVYSKRDWRRTPIGRMRSLMEVKIIIVTAVVMVVAAGVVLLVRYIIQA